MTLQNSVLVCVSLLALASVVSVFFLSNRAAPSTPHEHEAKLLGVLSNVGEKIASSIEKMEAVLANRAMIKEQVIASGPTSITHEAKLGGLLNQFDSSLETFKIMLLTLVAAREPAPTSHPVLRDHSNLRGGENLAPVDSSAEKSESALSKVVNPQGQTSCEDAIAFLDKGKIPPGLITEALNDCNRCASDHIKLRHCNFLGWRAMFFIFNSDELKVNVSFSRDLRRPTPTLWGVGYQFIGQMRYGLTGVEGKNFELLKTDGAALCNKNLAFVNIGVNDGFYSYAAGAFGCRVFAFEPQMGCVIDLLMGNAMNRFQHPAHLWVAAVSPKALSFNTSESCDGGGQYLPNGAKSTNPSNSLPQTKKALIPGRSVRLDEIVKEDVGMMIIDTEGAEVEVLRSGTKLFDNYIVHTAIIEWEMRRWGRFGVDIEEGALFARELAQKQNWECRRTSNTEFTRCDKLLTFFKTGSGFDIFCRRMEVSWEVACAEATDETSAPKPTASKPTTAPEPTTASKPTAAPKPTTTPEPTAAPKPTASKPTTASKSHISEAESTKEPKA